MKFTAFTIFLATAVATVSAKSWNIAKDLDEGGSNDACVANCNTGEGDRSGCFIKCQDTHKCNTEFAPVSYTDTADIAIVPDYVGPSVSYKGEKLDDLNDGNDRSNLDDSSSSKSQSDGDNKNSSSEMSALPR
ncbi:hypothetical protein BX661DRAFT_182190 [Kickxella alabastrina]|uniref:uncharacterized protein n=1 Tax=Kickxella alabastrina TaxID=61397 RepID=UPI0022211A48|nr:uncharacterized protein BX661DRAFT_182190 [Kickxella alabastrina]KAI7828491.1 hypothetical protein BX661DRAFT_182190 [Kickxella alabastrina]